MAITSPRERPVIMGAHSVKAILAGSKTQTRRVIKSQPETTVRYDGLCEDDPIVHYWEALNERGEPLEDYKSFRCPYGKVGDRLWVRETYFYATGSVDGGPDLIHYKATAQTELFETAAKHKLWQTPLFMPRDASRFTLELTDVRVERLQEISEADAVAEGYLYAGHGDDWQRHDSYRVAWDRLNAARGYSWDSDPWVFVLKFKQVEL